MNETVKKDVIAYIASYANIPVSSIKDEYILKNHPLKLDGMKLVYLAMSLRDYVKSLNPGETVLVTELRTKDLDVKKTCELIIKKVIL